MTTSPFVGANVALIRQGQVLCYLRDEKPGLVFSGLWDLPGGGSEGAESPETCVLRELHEEFGLSFRPNRLTWRRDYASFKPPGSRAWFFAGKITSAEIAAIRFGDEGQYWRMMPVAAFIHHPHAIRHLQSRLALFWAETEATDLAI